MKKITITTKTIPAPEYDRDIAELMYKFKQLGRHKMIAKYSTEKTENRRNFGYYAGDYIRALTRMTGVLQNENPGSTIYTATTKRNGLEFQATVTKGPKDNYTRQDIVDSLKGDLRRKIRTFRQGLRQPLQQVRRAFEIAVHAPGGGQNRYLLEQTYRNDANITGYRFITVGGTYTQPGTMGNFLQIKKSGAIYCPKKPNRLKYPNEKWVGIEIEACFPSASDLVLNLADWGEFVHIKGDGSIHPQAGDEGREVTICCPESKMDEVVTGVCRGIIKSGGYVNQSCGLHIHLDATKNYDPDPSTVAQQRNRCNAQTHATEMFDNLKKFQTIFFKMQPKSRQDNRFAKRVKGNFWKQHDRYRAINATAYHSHGTIEVRVHSATVDPKKILAFAKMCQRIAYAKFPPKSRPSVKLLRSIGCDNAIIDYMNTRIKTFAQSVNE